ncbi:MAG: hypothetical protein Q7S65_01995 [Nanoarchaeota archaeon]|nr:hypothetical protein [Nanoarchaeota archaeon]
MNAPVAIRTKQGIAWDMLGWWLLALIVLVIMLVLMRKFGGGSSGLLDKVFGS